MIDTIVFDIGHVLKCIHKDLTPLFDIETAKMVEDAIWGSGIWNELDKGMIPDTDLIQQMVDYAPKYEEQIRYVMGHLALISEMYSYSVEWVKELKKAGYQVYYLSNYSDIVRSQVPETLAFLPYMDGGIFSYLVKTVKPDPEIYQMLFEKFHLVPEHCLFIDDRMENVEAAIAQGMCAIQFTGYENTAPAVWEILKGQNF